MSQRSCYLDIERDGGEIEVVCRFECSSGSRGARDEYGVPLEPDEDPSAEFLDATVPVTREEVELTESEMDSAKMKMWDILGDEAHR